MKGEPCMDKDLCMVEDGGFVSLSFQQLRPLKPKPPKESGPDRHRVRMRQPMPPSPPKTTTTRKCAVPICSQENCQLRSHHLYKNTGSISSARPHTSSSSRRSVPLLHVKKLLGEHEPSKLEIGPECIENLGNLPIEGTFQWQEGVLKDMRQLFHRFFSKHFDKIHHLHYSHTSRLYAYKRATLDLALKEPLYCMTIIALSLLEEKKKETWCEDDPLRCSIYDMLLHHTSTMLKNETEAIMDLVVFGVVVMCLFDIAAGEKETLLIHREGLATLVSKIGGIHNLGLSLTYALSIDRSIAISTSMEPIFPGPNTSMNAFGSKVETTYGAGFRTSRLSTILRSDILGICKDCAQLMDFIESEKAEHSIETDSQSSDSTNATNIDHYFFIRDSIDFRLVCLLAKRREYLWHEECVLMASRIVEDIVLFEDSVPAINLQMSAEIWRRLSLRLGQDLKKEDLIMWGKIGDVLLWVLFTSALPRNLDKGHRSQVLKAISKVADFHFGGPVLWEHNEKQTEKLNGQKKSRRSTDVWLVLCQFVWCSTLKWRFIQICLDIASETSSIGQS